MVKTTTKGEEVFTLGYPEESPAYKPGADGKMPSYSPTNLAIAPNGDIYVGDGYGSSYINQYNKKGEYHPHLRRARQGSRATRDPARHRDRRRGKEQLLLVADRANNRLQHFTLDGQAHRSFVDGTEAALPLRPVQERRSVVVPDLGARVTLIDKNNKVIVHLGEDTSGKERELRKMSRDHFIPGKFVCPHGACFDHKGNIFVVEWVEVGRVSKLRKVA